MQSETYTPLSASFPFLDAEFNIQAIYVKGNGICHCMNLDSEEEGCLTLMGLMPIFLQRALKPLPDFLKHLFLDVAGPVI